MDRKQLCTLVFFYGIGLFPAVTTAILALIVILMFPEFHEDSRHIFSNVVLVFYLVCMVIGTRWSARCLTTEVNKIK